MIRGAFISLQYAGDLLRYRAFAPDEPVMHHLSKWFYISLGATLVAAGLLTVWTPLPVGVPLLLAGLPLLMRFSPGARMWILRIARRHPAVARFVRRMAPARASSGDKAR